MNAVIIKSFKNGLDVFLDDSIPFDQLIDEIKHKFGDSAKFFGTAKMALSFDGRLLSDDEEREVINAISESCDINICCIIEKIDTDNSLSKNNIYLKAINLFGNSDNDSSQEQVYKGTLKSGQVIDTASSIIVLGDVNPGATIYSGGSIVVLGTVYGTVCAGVTAQLPQNDIEVIGQEENHRDSSFIAALELRPTRIEIDGVSATMNDKGFKLGNPLRSTARIAYRINDDIYVEHISKEFLNNIPF